MRNYSARLCISPEAKKEFLEIIEEYKEGHPELKEVILTHNYMLKKLIKFWNDN